MNRTAGFSLVELLAVLGIVALAAALTLQVSSADRRDVHVRAAAEELAATMRLARAKAMDERATYGVAFNIRNAIGTSGKVLNNWDGGHWYRIIGPAEFSTDQYITGTAFPPSPSFSSQTTWNPNTWPAGYLDLVRASWIGDRHVLAVRKVRFLALADQDNGSQIDPFTNYSDTFRATYPRPWFGRFEAGSPARLHAWGGYDHARVDRYGRPSSGFYYEGKDDNGGAGIVGCANPADRSTTFGTAARIFDAGAGRPLINGDWLDFVIRFMPDGSAEQAPPFPARYESWNQRGASPKTGGTAPWGDLGDLCGMGNAGGTANRNNGARWYDAVMTSYVRNTGVYAITIGPDAERDGDEHPDLRSAWRSMMPAYRVVVSTVGQVRVVRVRPAAPSGSITWLPVNFTNVTELRTKYAYLSYVDASRRPYGQPVADFLTEQVLASGVWWMTP